MADATRPARDVFVGKLGKEAPRPLPSLLRGRHPAQTLALSVTALFVFAGLAWVVLTDILLYRIIQDPLVIARFETAKGWAFVAFGGVFLFMIVYRSASHLARVWRLTGAVLESIGDGILLLGSDRRIAHANPAALRMLGVRLEDVVGMGAPEFSRRFRISFPNGVLVPPDRYASQRVYDEGGPIHYNAVLHPVGGGEIFFAATAAAVRSQNREGPTWVVSVMHDITDLEEVARMRDRFFAAAAHAIKTPVAILKADAQGLLPALTPQHRKVAASIERQCDRIDRLVQNLMVLTRARSQTLEIHPVDLPLEPFLERIGREPVWSHRHQIRVEVSGSLRVHVDEERLALVIRNFIHEACRLAAQDSAISLEAATHNEHVRIAVRYQPTPWRDHASAVYDEYDDVGIGRSVASTIVEAHGGSISERTTDREVVVQVELPAPFGANG